MSPWQYLSVSLFLWSSVQSVDRSNFKTCDQSGFCKRHRALQTGQSSYTALLSTVKIQPTKLSLQILNTKDNVPLAVEMSALRGNMVRLRVTEPNPLRPRYEPPIGDVLTQQPVEESIKVTHQDSKSIGFSFNQNKVIIYSSPFRIDLLIDDEPVITVNSRGLMKFEHFREKDSNKAKEESEQKEGQPSEGDEVKKEETKVEEEPGLWEETFKSHSDSKPYGPSSVGLDFSFPGFQYVYGIPEHADTLALKSTKDTDPYRLFNLDVFEFELYNPMALYGAVPFMQAHNEKRTVGLFWLNAAETWVDIRSNVADKGMFSKVMEYWKGESDIPQTDTHWISESGIIDTFFLLGPSANQVFSQYASLTGSTPLPPLFALAYHQSRWNYNDQDDVASVNLGFDEHDIPMDVIWLDIEHTDGKRYFTWDGAKFSHAEDMVKNVSSRGRKMVTIVDPHLKRDDNYEVYKQFRDQGMLIKNKDSNDYDGWCWPGSSSWPDFTRADVRKFWAEHFHYSQYPGSTPDLFTWNDMNEPSVFNGPEITMHKDARHSDGFEHRDVHNLYGMYVHRATFEGQLLRSSGKERPFALSRAFCAGSQRFGAVWTGDNTGEWGHLKITLPMLMSLNLVGITFSGADVGGFFKSPDNELLTRWYQAGAFQPFYRAHAHIDTRRREPWLLEKHYMVAIRNALRMRYALLPYWYTLFYNAEKTGEPVMKPLWVDFPTEKQTFAVDDEHLIGSALLVHPVVEAGATGVSVYFPGQNDVWYDVLSYKSFSGGQTVYFPVTLDTIPVYQKGGTIVPRKNRIRRASSLTFQDPYTLIICLDVNGKAEGDLYIDDYYSMNYKKGKFAHRSFKFENKKLTNSNADRSGSFTTKSWLEQVVIAGLQSRPVSIKITQNTVTQSLEFTYKAETKILVIRKPAVNIVEDFVIALK